MKALFHFHVISEDGGQHQEPGMFSATSRTVYRQWVRQSLLGPSIGPHWFKSDLDWGEACLPTFALTL